MPCFFVLGASSSCNLLVMWGSRSETMWKAGLSRRNCSTSCGKWKAASAAVLPSGRSSLGSVKPGQGMGSVPGHAAGESSGGSLYKPWVFGLLLPFSDSPAVGQAALRLGMALAGGSVQYSYQWAVLAARGTCALSPRSVPADELTQSLTPCAHLFHGDVASDWIDSNCVRIFLFDTILYVSMTGFINT